MGLIASLGVLRDWDEHDQEVTTTLRRRCSGFRRRCASEDETKRAACGAACASEGAERDRYRERDAPVEQYRRGRWCRGRAVEHERSDQATLEDSEPGGDG